MEHFFTYIDIENFKSIKKLKIDGCKRINLFIGPPNVGKSNILEALSIFSLPFYKYNKSKKITSFIRIKHEAQLFKFGDVNNTISFRSDKLDYNINYSKSDGLNIHIYNNNRSINTTLKVDNYLNLKQGKYQEANNYIKKYEFNKSVEFEDELFKFLLPPFGKNILKAIEYEEEIKNYLRNVGHEFGLQVVFDIVNDEIKFQKLVSEHEVFTIPYISIADTLQRFIFHLAAIKSNQNSVILFEEPEAHCYPPYIAEIAQYIIEAETNQFFIATHSPVIVSEFLDDAFDETSIYIVGYENNQTVVKQLTDAQKMQVLTQGIDLFFNVEYFDSKK